MSTISLRTTLQELASRLIPEAQGRLIGPLAYRAEDIRVLLGVSLPYVLKVAEKAKNDLSTVDMETGRTKEYVLSKKAGIYTAAKKVIETEIAQAKADSLTLKGKLEKLALPPMPDGVSELRLFDAKRGLEDLLQAAGGPESVSIAAQELARKAAVEHDDLTCYLLGSGELKMFFTLRADKPEELAVSLSEITASGPAGQALAWWKGPLGIAACVAVCDTALFGELQDLQSQAQSYSPPPWREQ